VLKFFGKGTSCRISDQRGRPPSLLVLRPFQQVRQFGDVDRDPAGRRPCPVDPAVAQPSMIKVSNIIQTQFMNLAQA
jgi:hypothetical protein